MGLTLAQIDRLLTDWQQKAEAANQNLLDLYDLPAYQRLSGMGNPPSNVTGITQQQVSTALTAIDRLFEYLELFNQQIERARKLRRELPSLFISDSQLQEIEHLLTGISIELPSVQTPLAERGLISNHQKSRSTSLSELLDRMQVAFVIARDTFVAVEVAWTELESKLITTHQSLTDLQHLAQKLQLSIPPLLAKAQANFTNLQLEIERDPLAVDRTFTQDLTPLINNIRHELETLAQQRQQLQAEFNAAPQYLQQLRDLNRSAIAAVAESQDKIHHSLPIVSPIPAEELTELERWLERLVAKFEAGIFPPVRIGLTNWLNKVRAYTTAAESALVANRLPLDTRQELRGRLDALTAKALAKGQAEDLMLTDLATTARQALYTSPTDLNLAIELVRQYEQGLNHRLTC
jgi:predicted  nucleic acid-binding Zn-ribbon protein/DNA-binding transcriptional MerR regulator